MSSSIAITPLVPGANKVKKRKRGFRPVGKQKGNNASKKSSNASTAKSLKTEVLKKDDQREVTNETSGHSSNENEEKVSLTGEQGDTIDAQSTLQSQQLKPKAGARKRKQKQSTSISIGLGSGKGSRVTHEKPKHESIALVSERPFQESQDGLDTNSTSTAVPSSRRSPSLILANAHVRLDAVNPALTQDQALLEKLANEKSDGIKLNTLCSSFIGDPKPRNTKNGGRDTATIGNTSTPAANNHTKKSSTNGTQRKYDSGDNAQESSGAPVVKIVDGEIVLQESSLVVPGQRRTVQEVEEEFQDVVEEDAQLAAVGASYTSFIDRKGPRRWSVKETKQFFEGLRQFGTDFCSMEVLFENRSRKQLKRKYRTEVIRNPALVEMALDPKNRIAIDLAAFDVQIDPKSIEAAILDEPPPYIPTDVEDSDFMGKKEEQGNDAVATAAAIAASNTKGEYEREVIEEDATDETLGNKGESNFIGSENAKKVNFDVEEASIWPTVYEKSEEGPEESAVNDEDYHMLEPTMDDFFEEQGDISEPFKEESPMAEEPKPPSTELQNNHAASISLVPTKTNIKSKKPKFRTKTRKKK